MWSWLGSGCHGIEGSGYKAAFYGVLGAHTTQTQNEAAIAALQFIVMHTRGDVQVLPDSQFLVDCWQAITSSSLHSGRRHVERFALTAGKLAHRKGRLSITKVKAHTKLQDAAKAGGDMAIHHCIGNHRADRLAARAAWQAAPLASEIAKYDVAVEKVRRVQLRIMAVHKLTLALKPETRCIRLPMPSTLRTLLAVTGHILRWSESGKSVSCTRCCQTIPASRLRAWLRAGHCVPAPCLDDQGRVAAPTHSISRMVGRTLLKPTHQLCWS